MAKDWLKDNGEGHSLADNTDALVTGVLVLVLVFGFWFFGFFFLVCFVCLFFLTKLC